MDINKIKVPTLNCECKEIMEIVEQKHMDDDKVIQIKYSCKCGHTGLVIMRPQEGMYDKYVKDENGELKSHGSGELDEFQ